MDLPFLKELEKEEIRFKRFSMAGDGSVRVAGNLRTGFTVNIDKEGGGVGTPVVGACCLEDGSCVEETFGECLIDGGEFQGPGTTCDPNPCEVDCPRVETICADFSGLIACGCLTVNLNHYSITDISLNGLFTLPQTLALTDLVQWEGFGGTVRFEKFSTIDCSGDPDETCDVDGYIVVQCRRDSEGNLLHTITYSVEHFDVCVSGWGTTQAQIFRLNDASGPLVFESIENTEIGCGLTGTGTGIASDGVVTVHSGAC